MEEECLCCESIFRGTVNSALKRGSLWYSYSGLDYLSLSIPLQPKLLEHGLRYLSSVKACCFLLVGPLID